MREILFRGKRKDNGKWVEGGLLYSGSDYYIIQSFLDRNDKGITNIGIHYKIISETVGQFTGLKDINSKKIFEGDIVDDFYSKGQVVFENGVFKAKSPTREFYLYPSNRLEIIGNIHDNPELLNKI